VTAKQRSAQHKLSIDNLIRKYLGSSVNRLIHILAQIYIETGILSVVVEGGQGENKPYDAFYGRGYMQLTWPSNYLAYGAFRGIAAQATPHYLDTRITATSTHIWSDGQPAKQWGPRFDPDLVASDLNHSAESGGVYWISKHFRGTNNINRVCDLGISPTQIAFTSWLVNGGGNGYNNRQEFAQYLSNILTDEPIKTGSAVVNYPPLTPAGNPTLCTQFPPVEIPYSQHITIHYDRQVP
jgi:predicted chitinase